MLYTTVKLDKERKIKFTIGLQMKIEQELKPRKIHDLMTDMSITEAVTMLSIALAAEDNSITFEKTQELIDDNDVCSNDVIEWVATGLLRAVMGQKGSDFIDAMEGKSVKNASGPDTTGENSLKTQPAL